MNTLKPATLRDNCSAWRYLLMLQSQKFFILKQRCNRSEIFNYTLSPQEKKHEGFIFNVPVDSIRNYCISAQFQKGKLHGNKIGKNSLQLQWIAIPIWYSMTIPNTNTVTCHVTSHLVCNLLPSATEYTTYIKIKSITNNSMVR